MKKKAKRENYGVVIFLGRYRVISQGDLVMQNEKGRRSSQEAGKGQWAKRNLFRATDQLKEKRGESVPHRAGA